MTDEPDLEAAYNLGGPDGAKKLYRDWAQTYDDDFAADRMYLLPNKVAEGHIPQAVQRQHKLAVCQQYVQFGGLVGFLGAQSLQQGET